MLFMGALFMKEKETSPTIQFPYIDDGTCQNDSIHFMKRTIIG